MNFYDVLAAEKWDGGIPTINFFDLLFAQSMGGEQWQTYEGTLPATINANGDNMKQYQVYGAAGGVGDKTINYFDYRDYVDGYYISSSGVETESSRDPVNKATWLSHSDYISILSDESYTISAYHKNMNTPQVVAIAWYDESKTFISRDSTTIPQKEAGSYSFTATAPQNAKFAIFNFFADDAQRVMFTPGITPPETFVPYGYKLDMSVSDGTSTTTTPIYIGDEPLEKINNYSDYVDYDAQKVVRNIKKYVLTSKEDWEEITGTYPSRTYFRYVFAPINYCVRHICTCSHFTQAAITTATTTVGFDVFDSTSVNGEVLAIRPANVQSMTFADFKEWLVQQYVNGTPVTVWCALTVAEETDPPVPLPALPTCDETTIVDYAGQSVAPEKVYFEYKGGKQP